MEANEAKEINKNENEEEDEEEEEAEYYSYDDDDDENGIFEWKFGQLIGKGSQSSVYMMINCNTKEISAAKVYQHSTLFKRTFEIEEPLYVSVIKEIKLMANMKHRFILRLNEVIEDDVSKALFLFMPYAQFGNLQSFVDDNVIDEETFSVCFYQIAEAMRYMHSQNIVHRDLKAENVLVFSKRLFQVSDFSVSEKLEKDDAKFNDPRGPPAYLSPEVLNEEDYYPKPVDVWAFGVAMYKCMFGVFPFDIESLKGQSVTCTMVNVIQLVNQNELVIPPSKDKFNPLAIDLIINCLQKDPTKRPTFEEIVQNPWFDFAKTFDKEIQKDFEEKIQKEEEKIQKWKEKEEEDSD